MTEFRVTFVMDVTAPTAAAAAYQVANALAEGDPYMGTYDVTNTETNETTEERPA